MAIRLHTRPRDVGPTTEPFIQPQLAMPGVLFYPWHHALPPPREATHEHFRGLWLHWSEWRNFRDGLPRGIRAAWLAKPHWLALPRDEAFTSLRDVETRLAQHFLGHGPPVQIALLAGGDRHTDDGYQRLFVVADDWPRQIPLPPPIDLG